jgi:hypothetical protein
MFALPEHSATSVEAYGIHALAATCPISSFCYELQTVGQLLWAAECDAVAAVDLIGGDAQPFPYHPAGILTAWRTRS